MEIKITPSYVPERSSPDDKQFFFEYNLEIITEIPIQFLEYELKMRCEGKEYEFYCDHLNSERPYIKDYYKTTKFIPSNSAFVNLRGILTFVDDNSNIHEVELPLTFLS